MDSSDDAASKKYLHELLQELTKLTKLRSEDPTILAQAMNLLSAEVQRVWTQIYGDDDPNKILSEKIPIPEMPDGKDETGRRCNLIGRIVGPNGMSVRQLEAQSGCEILVRGKGSIKDQAKHDKLVGTSGFEHLSEPLHVLVTATGPKAQEKLLKGVELVQNLLRPCHDEYKRLQLTQLAMINGTYRRSRRI